MEHKKLSIRRRRINSRGGVEEVDVRVVARVAQTHPIFFGDPSILVKANEAASTGEKGSMRTYFYLLYVLFY
jgi:hypothetical protein